MVFTVVGERIFYFWQNGLWLLWGFWDQDWQWPSHRLRLMQRHPISTLVCAGKEAHSCQQGFIQRGATNACGEVPQIVPPLLSTI